jgi:LacI family transcriptional regulator
MIKTSLRDATIHDIARVTGVSIGTVSRALNNKPGVHPETRAKVLAASRELKVKSRVGARRKQVAILVADTDRLTSETYAGTLSTRLMIELSARDMFGMFITSSEIERLTCEIFDGVVTMSWRESDLDVLRSLTQTPIIMARCCKHNKEFQLAGWNHHMEGELVAKYLLEKGHRKIAMMHKDPGDPLSLERRWEGFVDKSAKMGVQLVSDQCVVYESRSRMGPVLKKIIDAGVDGLWIPGHEYLAAEGIKILQEVIGVRVPKDLSVVGSENSGISPLLQPSLTTVAAPFQDLAFRIIDDLIEAMRSGKRPSAAHPILLNPVLLERDSVISRF